jgi:hypothetical protein
MRAGMQVLDKDKLWRENMMEQIKREITIMKDLHHPNIVDLKEVMASKDKIYMVMEFMPGGELFDRIVAEGPLDVRALATCLLREPQTSEPPLLMQGWCARRRARRGACSSSCWMRWTTATCRASTTATSSRRTCC